MAHLANLTNRRRALVVAALAAIAVVPVGFSLLGDGPVSEVERAAQILGLLESRSPGERSYGQLVKSKRSDGIAGVLSPEDFIERALGKTYPGAGPPIVTQEAPGGLPEELLTLGTPMAVFESPLAELALVEQVNTGPRGGGGLFVPPIFIDGGGGGPNGPGGGGGGGPGVGPDPLVSPPPAVAPVPEPGTWAMMLVGMGMCGFALRRRRRLKSPQPDGICTGR